MRESRDGPRYGRNPAMACSSEGCGGLPGDTLRLVMGRLCADSADEGSGQGSAAALRFVPNTGLREEPPRAWFGGVWR